MLAWSPMRAGRLLLGLVVLVACSDSKRPATDAGDPDQHEVSDAAVVPAQHEPRDGDAGSPTRDGASPRDAAPADAAQVLVASDAGRLPPGPPVDVTPEGAGALQFHGSDVCLLDALGDIQCRNLPPVWKPYRKGPFKAMALATLRGCGIAPDDSVSCWTDRVTSPGLCTGEVSNCVGGGSPPAEKFAQISIYNQTACVVTTTGGLRCWGKDDYGRATPPSGDDFASVTLASELACALRRDGSAACWAPSSSGDVTMVAGQGKQLTISSNAICLLGNDGKVSCSGGYSDLAKDPQATDLAQISGQSHALCGLTKAGAARCWSVVDNTFERVPPPIGPFKSIINTTQYACGLRGDGQLECWGQFWGNGSGSESCLLDQQRLSIDGQPERVERISGFSDDRAPPASGLRSSTSSDHGFVLLETAAVAARDLGAIGAAAGSVALRSGLFMLSGSDTSVGELYCAGPSGNGQVQRHDDELLLDFSELSLLGQCPGSEAVEGSLSACIKSSPCATTALTGSLRGESKNVSRRYEAGWITTAKLGYADGSLLIAHEKPDGQPGWGVLVLPPDAAGQSEVICAGSLSKTGGIWTLGSFTSLGRCRGAGTHTLKGCVRP